MASISTAAFIFTLFSVCSLPPTPPAPFAVRKEFAGLWVSIRTLFTNQRFVKLTLSDFLVSGPPLVFFGNLVCIFPARTSHVSSWASVAGIALAVPLTVLTGHLLDRWKAFWTFSMAGYACGTVLWLLGTVCYASGTLPGAYAFVGAITLALAAYISWQTAVYETKLEYVFSPDTSLEGIVVASDRMIINFSGLVFLSAIPPERVGGALNTFYIGLAVMFVGRIPTALIRDRWRYLRLAFDKSCNESEQGDILDADEQLVTESSQPNMV